MGDNVKTIRVRAQAENLKEVTEATRSLTRKKNQRTQEMRPRF
jgi:hypothetical protein